ncbi:MAG: DUF4199 domain-containing protein [Bacteroidaceae bacterium]|nr:DUF4199 domain-containing protein [Bacteroidaceae bacterium]
MTNNTERKSLLVYSMEGGAWLGAYLIVRFFCGVAGIYIPLLNSVAMLLFIGTPFVVYRIMLQYHKRNGYVSGFSLLWMMGIMLFFFASLISCIPEYVFYQYISPDYIANAIAQSLKLIEELGVIENTATLDEMRQMLQGEAVPTSMQMVMSSMWSNVFFGSLLSIVVAPFVLRKKNKENIKS